LCVEISLLHCIDIRRNQYSFCTLWPSFAKWSYLSGIRERHS